MEKLKLRGKIEINCKFLNPERIKSNIESIISYSRTKGSDANSFWEAINYLQDHGANLKPDSQGVKLIWYKESDIHLNRALTNLMGLEDNESLPNGRAYTYNEIHNITPKIEKGLNLLKKTFPEIYPYFKVLNPFILIAKRDGYYGGTASNRLGFIWLSPIKEWETEDYGEQLFHEFIHNALFIEEMVNMLMPHTAKRMDQKDGLVTSAIRQVSRGYDKSYHAAFVSYGLICYYLALGKINKAKIYFNPLIICLDELVKNQKFLSANGTFLLDELCENVLNKKKLVHNYSELKSA